MPSPQVHLIAEAQGAVFRAVARRVLDALRTADTSLPLPDNGVRGELRTAQLARQLGLSRADRIGEAFTVALGSQADEQARPDTPPKPAGRPRLQLLDDDALDADLALKKLVRKTIDEIDPESLAALEMRVGELQGSAPVDQDSNPLGPRTVVLALYEATLAASEEAEVRVALASLLQPHVAAALRTAYDEANAMFIAAGVLPETTFRVQKRESEVRGGADVGLSQPMSLSELLPAIHGLPDMLELQRMLRGLVSARRAAPAPVAARILSDARNAYHGAAVASPADPATLAALMAVQQIRDLDTGQFDERELDDLDAGAGLADADDAGDPLAMLRASAAGGLPALDQLTGQLVAVVLEFVLRDAAVPDSVKKQISRLQIVAFRAALLDRTFFARREHPFRQLLDRIGTLASEPEHAAPGSAFQNTLVRITDDLVTDFHDDLGIFAEKLAELDATLDFADDSQAQAVAQAIAALPEMEALDGVRQRALAAIDAKMHAGVPPAIVEFLRGIWVDVLIATWRARGGEQLWSERMDLAERLLWSLRPHGRDRLADLSRSLPAIVTGIRRAMEDASIPPETRQQVLEHLFAAHQNMIRLARLPVAPEGVLDEAAVVEASLRPPAPAGRIPLRAGLELAVMRDGEEARARIVAVGADRLLCVLAFADGVVRHERCAEIEARIETGDIVLLSSPHGIVERALALMGEPQAVDTVAGAAKAS